MRLSSPYPVEQRLARRKLIMRPSSGYRLARTGRPPSIVPPSGPFASKSDSRDPLSRMRAYRLARALIADSWSDAERLRHHLITEKISGQLYAAVGSIAANISEGYSRSSGRDRARIFEYALGSVRESMTWYESAAPVLGEEVMHQRLETLEEVRRLLLAVIPRERQRLIRPSEA